MVRHGQARPFDANPDKLSELGEEQARQLGAYWKKLDVTFDEVWSGSLERQLRTAEIALDITPQISEDWNEYDANGILHHFAPLYELDAGADRDKKFQKVFEPAVLAWQAAEDHPHVETWGTFRTRVIRGLRQIQQGSSGRKVALFTSGGPVAALVQEAIAGHARSFLELNWRVKNCSVTEFTFSKEKLSLDLFNSLAHLNERMRTFR